MISLSRRFSLLDQAWGDLPIELADIPLIGALFGANAWRGNDLRVRVGRQAIDVLSRILAHPGGGQGCHFWAAFACAGKDSLDAALCRNCDCMVDESGPDRRCILVCVERRHQPLNVHGLASDGLLGLDESLALFSSVGAVRRAQV